jgi:hypothetical protein
MPQVADLAFMLRLGEDKITALLDEFVDKGLFDSVEGEPMRYAGARCCRYHMEARAAGREEV